MKDYKKIYQEWLTNPYFDEATKNELRAIANDENEIKERFYQDLAFGTAASWNYWCGHQPNECVCGQKSNTGTC